MATAPTPTITTAATSWLKTHERIVIVALCLALGVFGLGKIYDVDAARKEAKYVAAAAIAANDKANSAALAQQSAQTQSQYLALVQALSAQNASLASSMAQRTASLKVQQAADAAMTPSELTAHWTTLVPSVKAIPDGNLISANVQGVQDTVVQLEQVPVLVQNLADETKIAGNYQAEVEKSDLLLADYGAQITGLNTQLTAQTKACTAEVAAVKASGKKNSVKWFKRGFLVGFLAGLYAGHAL